MHCNYEGGLMMKRYLLFYGFLMTFSLAESSEVIDKNAVKAGNSARAILCSSAYYVHATHTLKDAENSNIDEWHLFSDGAMYVTAMALSDSTNPKDVTIDALVAAKELRDYYSEILIKDKFQFIYFNEFFRCPPDNYKKPGALYRARYKDILN